MYWVAASIAWGLLSSTVFPSPFWPSESAKKWCGLRKAIPKNTIVWLFWYLNPSNRASLLWAQVCKDVCEEKEEGLLWRIPWEQRVLTQTSGDAAGVLFACRQLCKLGVRLHKFGLPRIAYWSSPQSSMVSSPPTPSASIFEISAVIKKINHMGEVEAPSARPHENPDPRARDEKVIPPTTSCGVSLDVVVLSPSCPYESGKEFEN